MKWINPVKNKVPDHKPGDLILCEFENGFHLFKIYGGRGDKNVDKLYVECPNSWENKGSTIIDFTDKKNCPFRYLIIPT